jgi:hypothetical protein
VHALDLLGAGLQRARDGLRKAVGAIDLRTDELASRASASGPGRVQALDEAEGLSARGELRSSSARKAPRRSAAPGPSLS